ncbi:MAG TPA: sulfotransferase [Anaerolineales bacterium]|nr:sulfotransferase [Anaerolineales bacterium]
MNKGPIFIGGLDRCGKTTLRAFLVSHPNVSIPAVGSNMWTYFYGQFGDLSDPANFERCMDAMLHYKHVRFLKPEAEEIRQLFRQGPATYARLFGLFLEQHARRQGKPRWGEQTGLIERYIDRVFETFIDGRMIHMIRDPRDRYVESLKMWPNGKGRAGGAVARWLYTTSLARRNLKKYPQQYLVVHFEDMVRAPEETLKTICQFIGEHYVPEMLELVGAPDHRAKMMRTAGDNQTGSILSDQHIGMYRKGLSKYELAFMHSITQGSLREFGYEVEPVHFSLLERLAYIFWHWPANFVRMMTWLGIEYFQQNYPQTFGRKPASKMIIKNAKA